MYVPHKLSNLRVLKSGFECILYQVHYVSLYEQLFHTNTYSFKVCHRCTCPDSITVINMWLKEGMVNRFYYILW